MKSFHLLALSQMVGRRDILVLLMSGHVEFSEKLRYNALILPNEGAMKCERNFLQ